MQRNKILALLILLFAVTDVVAQTPQDTLRKSVEISNDAGNKQDYSNPVREQSKERKTDAGLIPDVIIILNYKQVISMEQYLKIKNKGDLLKQYTIHNKELVGEVQKIMIVETKNKDQYREMKIR